MLTGIHYLPQAPCLARGFDQRHSDHTVATDTKGISERIIIETNKHCYVVYSAKGLKTNSGQHTDVLYFPLIKNAQLSIVLFQVATRYPRRFPYFNGTVPYPPMYSHTTSCLIP